MTDIFTTLRNGSKRRIRKERLMQMAVEGHCGGFVCPSCPIHDVIASCEKKLMIAKAKELLEEEYGVTV